MSMHVYMYTAACVAGKGGGVSSAGRAISGTGYCEDHVQDTSDFEGAIQTYQVY